jgi:hypothetical protein
MKALMDNDTIQIEITNHCRFRCSNCTRFVGHHREPYFMNEIDFKNAVDSLEGFPKMVGFQGGEPLMHPQFAEFCKYARSKFSKEQLGLWSTFPPGYEHHREVIVETFGHVFLNDHSINAIYHHPVLVGIEEMMSPAFMWYSIDHCSFQRGWSASINPKGAFFCEIAASMAMLFHYEESKAWPVEPGWFCRTTKDYTAQIEKWCPRCGMAAPLKRRISTEGIDDISPKNAERLKYSPKVIKGECRVHNLEPCRGDQGELAAYKLGDYRSKIAKRYGIFLVSPNEKGFWTPYLYKEFNP